ncbi:HAD family hydrolase [Lawsonibacter celer]|jgi:HAD superfamily hydrolase (TIGR01509 family)|uniref:HAD family hydrolase n=1 Tax=Lawsonibacter celer TaxID=2986526 RepID=UPI001644584D|nr:HAD family phosphatase [Lawsonibacter celer]
MDKKYCIFDMDGTLTDSMDYWNNLGADYLRTHGVQPPEEELFQRMKGATLAESALYFMEHFGVPGPAERIVDEFNQIMADHYRNDIPLKPGVAEYLRALRAVGVRLAVASATSLHLVRACLGRLGIEELFDAFSSCESIGKSKEFPDVYLQAAKQLGAAPTQCAVFEDALFAAQTAKAAGFYTVGVYEKAYAAQWAELTTLCDETVEDWSQSL